MRSGLDLTVTMCHGLKSGDSLAKGVGISINMLDWGQQEGELGHFIAGPDTYT
jgi:hypothetical protein